MGVGDELGEVLGFDAALRVPFLQGKTGGAAAVEHVEGSFQALAEAKLFPDPPRGLGKTLLLIYGETASRSVSGSLSKRKPFSL